MGWVAGRLSSLMRIMGELEAQELNELPELMELLTATFEMSVLLLLLLQQLLLLVEEVVEEDWVEGMKRKSSLSNLSGRWAFSARHTDFFVGLFAVVVRFLCFGGRPRPFFPSSAFREGSQSWAAFASRIRANSASLQSAELVSPSTTPSCLEKSCSSGSETCCCTEIPLPLATLRTPVWFIIDTKINLIYTHAI